MSAFNISGAGNISTTWFYLSMLLTSFTVLNILSDLSVFLPHPLKEIKYHEELGRNIKYLYFLSKLYLLLKLMIRCAEPEIKY